MRALLLAAGYGTRLQPLTINWPKCLMPIGDKPLLEYWLEILFQNNINEVLVNLHYLSEIVKEFLERPLFNNWVKYVYETELLGTAGTLRANYDYFKDESVLLIHSDNWCQCNFSDFINFHKSLRPSETSITMMTFNTDSPKTCGIVECDNKGIVLDFHEKVNNPPGNIANAAVYILEPEVLNWLKKHPEINDFSTEVLPAWIGHIATWHNDKIHRDIGTIDSLQQAQKDPIPKAIWKEKDFWSEKFLKNPIHKKIKMQGG